jgi:hypothetical protein
MFWKRKKDAFVPLVVKEVKPLEDYLLYTKFDNGRECIFDFKPELQFKAFEPLKNKDIFNAVTIDMFGVTSWKNGEIDISPEYLLSKGKIINS